MQKKEEQEANEETAHKMHANNHSTHSTNALTSLILPNPLIPPTPGVAVALLDKIADPAAHALFAFGVLAENRLSVLHFDGRRVDVEVGYVGIDVGAVDPVVAEAERRHGRASVAKEGLCFGESLGCGSHRGRVAEERVHVFQAHVGGFGVDEPD